MTVRRFLAAFGVWGVVMAVMLFAGMGPRPVLLAVAIVVVGVAGAAVIDLSFGAEPASWRIEPPSDAPARRGRDVRAERLTLQVVRLHDAETPNEELQPLLIGLIESEVRRRHGIDRRHDPDAFARVIGPRLADFVESTHERDAVMSRRSVTEVLDRIESL